MAISRHGRLAAEVAEVLAVQVLAFIAEDGERLGRFLAITGMGPGEIREAAHERHFLSGVLDYLASDEELLVAFAKHAGVEPNTIAVAQQALAESEGGEDV